MENKILELKRYIEDNLDYLTDEDINNLIEKNDLQDYKSEIIGEYGVIKNNQGNSITLYFNELKKYKILTENEIQDLCIKIKNNDKDAREKLIKHNLRLVVMVAKKYLSSNVDFWDLIEEGNMGLMKAVDLYDYKLGYKFSTYAYCWIKCYIERAIEGKYRNAVISEHSKRIIRKIDKYEEELMNIYKRSVTSKELADYINKNNTELCITEEKIDKLKSDRLSFLSLNHIIKESDKDTEDIEFLKSKEDSIESVIEEKIFIETLSDILSGKKESNLTPMEQKVLIHRLGVNCEAKSLQEIATMFNVTRERIRQVQNKGLRKLKTYKKTKNIFDGYKVK